MKKLLAILLALAMCFSLFGCQQTDRDEENTGKSQIQETTPKDTEPEKTEPEETEPEETEPEQTSTPLLYKVSDEEGNVIWLFGSIHVGLEEFYPLPDYVMDAFFGSDALAVEADIVAFESDLSGQMAVLRQMLYTDGTTIADHIPDETYAKAVMYLEESNLYNKAMDSYIPAMWWSFLESVAYMKMDYDANLGVDRHLLKLAKEEDIPILEVESAQEQYAILAAMSEPLQIFLLEQAISMNESLALNKIAVKMLMKNWAEGNETALSVYLNKEPVFKNEEEKQLYQEYSGVLVDERNESMTQYAIEALESGEEIFICVGAAHVVGAGAMAENLRELGYIVETVQ